MTEDSRLMMRIGAAAVVAVVLLLIGAGGTYLIMRGRPQTGGTTPPVEPAQPSATAPGATRTPPADVVIALAPDAIQRAGIVVGPVTTGSVGAELRLPGVVEPNAYRQVTVTPLVGGRMTQVSAVLGERVRRGQSMAEIYSPELAQAVTRYVSARAMLDAHDRELQRTLKLSAIGAVSKQELEKIHAEHAAQTAEVQSARSQLELLGVPAAAFEAAAAGKEISALSSVPAPIDGIVTERTANVGLNVDPATKLFTVVDLSTVWVVADVYERDFSRVHVGTDANITTAAYPGMTLRGRISYIDPQVSPGTRTAKVRVEVANPGGQLRLGMYADVSVAGAAAQPMPVIPRSAVQNIGEQTVVYLANSNDPGKFVEREVRLGAVAGDVAEVVSGVVPGDVIVREGSFFIRAERDRLGLRTPAGTGSQATVQTAKIVVSEKGFEPGTITLRAGAPARLTFVRTSDKTCATEVVFPSLKIKRALPLNEAVTIEFTPEKSEMTFTCGMNMLKGTLLVK